MSRSIVFYNPDFSLAGNRKKSSFPVFSVTGPECSLNCAHCGKVLLAQMEACLTPSELMIRLEKRIEMTGRLEGMLLTGGCDLEGKIPLQNYFEIIPRIKERWKIPVLVHTGLVDETDAFKFAAAGVDIAMLDIFGETRLIKKITGLLKTPADYIKTLRNLKRAGLKVVPHIILGIDEGKIKNEKMILQLLEGEDFDALAFLILKPVPGTVLENAPLPDPTAVKEIFYLARNKFPDKKLLLGCARPRSGSEGKAYEEAAVDCKFNGLVCPSESTAIKAAQKRMVITEKKGCCALACIEDVFTD